jgi:hypothetical protein
LSRAWQKGELSSRQRTSALVAVGEQTIVQQAHDVGAAVGRQLTAFAVFVMWAITKQPSSARVGMAPAPATASSNASIDRMQRAAPRIASRSPDP